MQYEVESDRAATESERRFRQLADCAPVMIWRSSPEKLCDWFNKPWLDFTGRTMEEELGFGWAEGVHPEDYDRCLTIFTTAFDARQPFTMDYRLRRHDGDYRWIRDNGTPFYDETGALGGYFGSGIDVTDHIERGEELNRAIAEKEVLLRELHHRVKNNMQLIVSLLAMLGRRSGVPEVKTVLSDAAQRVHLLGLAQEELHGLGTANRVDLGRYLPQLAGAVAGMLDDGRIRLDFAVVPISVEIDRAMAVGSLVNELLTNSIKHAFPDRRSGTIRIEARHLEDGAAEVVVADDGIGMPGGNVQGIGMRLATQLAVRARGELRLEASDGTRATLILRP